MSEAQDEVTLEQALKLVLQLMQDERLEAAEQLCRRILQAAPGHPDALHLLGMSLHRMGREADALQQLQAAIAAEPDFPDFHNNLGNIHALAGRRAEATAAFERAIQLRPDAADWHNNLGALYKYDQRLDEAEACYREALRLEPRHIRAMNNLGLLHAQRGDLSGAVRCYLQAIASMPGDQDARSLLGMTYYTLKRYEEAAEVFRQWLADAPGHPVPQHMLAALTGQAVPERAPDVYVEHTFDRFAASFEQTLNERLDYRAPGLCAALVADCMPLPLHLHKPQQNLRVLDAGCGTGLCGPLLKPWAAELAGVDLSRRMLDLAQTKGVYTDLYKAELTEFLRESPGHWQLIVSADTLCYFGDLQALMQAAAGALAPGGWLVFSVEALDDADDRAADRASIQPSGRYAHSRAHIERTLQEAGLRLHRLQAERLRNEGGNPVAGWLVAAQLSTEAGIAEAQRADHHADSRRTPS